MIWQDLLYCLWRLSEATVTMRDVGRGSNPAFADVFPRLDSVHRCVSLVAGGASGSDRLEKHPVRNEPDLWHHVGYNHINPIKHGYVAAAKDWPYPSRHHDVGPGMLSSDWAGWRAGTPPSIAVLDDGQHHQ